MVIVFHKKEYYITTFLFFFFYKFIYLFLAVLGLRFCVQAFPSCGERGLLFIAVRGLLIVVASLVVEHRLYTRRLLIVVASLVVEHRLYTRRLSSCGSRA